jgi:hypothetical protein
MIGIKVKGLLRQLILPSGYKEAVLRKRLLCIGLGSLTCSSATEMQGQDGNADETLHDRLLQSDLPLADEGVAPANVKLELKALSLLSAPVIVQLTALYAISTVNQYFIGHLGAAPLAAAAIGNTVSTAKAQVSASCDCTYERVRTATYPNEGH